MKLERRKIKSMKQYITISDINQLTDSQKENLHNLWKPKFYNLVATIKDFEDEIMIDVQGTQYCNVLKSDLHAITLPLLSIGQMIEILKEREFNYSFGDYFIDYNWSYSHVDELCDSLWEDMREIL
jgi:hypothetical protein